MSITTLPRKFKYSSLELSDPAPDLPPKEALALYTASYPELAVADIGEPTIVDGELIYEIEKKAVKTKG